MCDVIYLNLVCGRKPEDTEKNPRRKEFDVLKDRKNVSLMSLRRGLLFLYATLMFGKIK